jgi:hypothetical protein
MGFRFRKSFRIAPGIRINLSKKGLSSVSLGGRGATLNVGSDSGSRVTVGIPGTGLSYSERLASGDADPDAVAADETVRSGPGFIVSLILWLGAISILYLFLR